MNTSTNLFDRSDFASIEYDLEELDKAGKFKVKFPSDADFLSRKKRRNAENSYISSQLGGRY